MCRLSTFGGEGGSPTDASTRNHYSARHGGAARVGATGVGVKRKASTTRKLRGVAATAPAAGNELLAALPPDVLERLSPDLELVPLRLRDILHPAGEPIEYVYFPGGGFVSELTVLESGDMVEIATIGREGMVGIFASHDEEEAPSLSMVQAATDVCHRLTAKQFRAEMERRGAFHELMTRYMHAHVGLIMQSTACNAMHTVEQRLARWLLMAHDRVGLDDFPLTQEFVAMMLGVSRPSVTIVAGTLQKAGLITYRRGHLTIIDREGLEAASCECYRVVQNLLAAVRAPRRTSRREGR
jgi:CRP-like cAMP-binding protein